MNANNRLNLSAGIASASIALTLVALKIWALGGTGALSVAASLADSAMDLMVSIGGLVAIIYAARPADEDHAFGHSSVEDLAALGQSLFILLSAGVIGYAAIMRLFAGEPVPLTNESQGIAAMVLSIILTLALVLWQRYVMKRTKSRVVAADSLHYVGDLLPALGAILSLWASRTFGLETIDSVVAIGAAIMLAVGAIGIFRKAFDALMDRAADEETIAGIEALVREFPGVHGYHDLKTRTAGSVTFVNLHIELDGAQTLDEAHAIGAALRREILSAFPGTDVLIHKDPVGVEPHPDDPSRT
ncbi:cation diffusion facilitator family transporter [Maritimibacter dapengensis]|uniref:Cation diffusion facilitator family transporter n=1 Tax=Maritimibacter dapengensis TaxID=2836868 RepID=A0ABS6T5W2_9RHOB|nr:cation diffusion facilitator family transporter [Maritimibacter dapengensis]MBV7380668.1 cation diffusion facilitator family transporter [Maritimibacter dapengensis]